MDDRQMLGSVIASEMAKTDPIEALTWARTNEKGQFPYLELAVLGQLAETDPQLALAEALYFLRKAVPGFWYGFFL